MQLQVTAKVQLEIYKNYIRPLLMNVYEDLHEDLLSKIIRSLVNLTNKKGPK